MKSQDLMLVAVTLVFALGCAQDKASVSAEKRAEIQSRLGRPSGGGNGGSTAQGPTVRLGSFGISSFLLDQKAMLLHLALAATKEEAQFLGNMKVELVAGNPNDLQLKLIDFDLTSKPQPKYIQKEQMSWNIQSLVRSEELVYLRGFLESYRTSVDLAEKSTDPKKREFLNFFPRNFTISLVKKGDKTLLKSLSDGEIMISLGGVTERSPFRMQVNLEVADLNDQEEIEILSSRGNFEILRSRPFSVEVSSQKSLKFLNSNCPLVVGKIKLGNPRADAKIPAKVLEHTTEKSFVEDTAWSVPVANCGDRPLVDFSKILIY